MFRNLMNLKKNDLETNMELKEPVAASEQSSDKAHSVLQSRALSWILSAI